MECDITFEKPVLKDMEEIARLLLSMFLKRQKAIMSDMLFLLQII